MTINNIQDTENVNDWIDWIENSISKKHIKYYKFEDFSNIQEIGVGLFGKIFRANWKTTDQYFALKSFFNLNNATVKKIVHKVKYDFFLSFFLLYCSIIYFFLFIQNLYFVNFSLNK